MSAVNYNDPRSRCASGTLFSCRMAAESALAVITMLARNGRAHLDGPAPITAYHV